MTRPSEDRLYCADGAASSSATVHPRGYRRVSARQLHGDVKGDRTRVGHTSSRTTTRGGRRRLDEHLQCSPRTARGPRRAGNARPRRSPAGWRACAQWARRPCSTGMIRSRSPQITRHGTSRIRCRRLIPLTRCPRWSMMPRNVLTKDLRLSPWARVASLATRLDQPGGGSNANRGCQTANRLAGRDEVTVRHDGEQVVGAG